MDTYGLNIEKQEHSGTTGRLHTPEFCHRPRLIILVRHGESESNKDKSINEHIPNHLIALTDQGWAQAKQAGAQLLKVLNLENEKLREELDEKYRLPDESRKLLPLHDYKQLNKTLDENIVFYTSPYRRTRETLKGILDVIDEYNLKNAGVHACQSYQPCGKQKHAVWPTPFPSGVYENNEHTHCLQKKDKTKTYVQYRVKDDPRIREQDFGNFQEITSMQDVMEKRQTYGHFFFRFPQGESAADVYDRVASFQETLFRSFYRSSTKKPRDVVVLVTHGIYSRVFLMKWFRWTYEEYESFINVPNGSLMVMELDEANDRYMLRTELPKWC
ncbi:hypothetical protein TBLA_0I02030 [Henningerozyma blattae CBS 6284]|uniref:Uncharacterized protein n=1 Tax=Henningerozyma blattae (strain ATCC 34711 / CBS 6284 / DSM 70876 / NBRC 10599 / NRRL Y-10934 / UCD 77-7) TaxID=1071380 RepID=I2H909_HENB6|nr:hypothetical protein TBLA_0I02030 [Tetrapisispora blattae CBS 6284]CCH62861.1 hypothetical protein TBLA_0I02030 [Tetrapisispora blattae CBS 6284]